MKYNNDPNSLQHYGILGMHWGVRRYQNKDGSLTPAGRKKQKRQMSSDAKEVSEIKKKKISEMSNAELKKLNERQNLERNYKLSNPSMISKGFKIAGTTAAALGTILSLKQNGTQIISIGRGMVNKIIKK